MKAVLSAVGQGRAAMVLSWNWENKMSVMVAFDADVVDLCWQLCWKICEIVEPLSEDEARRVDLWFGIDGNGGHWTITGDVREVSGGEFVRRFGRTYDFVGKGGNGVKAASDAMGPAWDFAYDWCRHFGVKPPGKGDVMKELERREAMEVAE